MHSLIVYWPLIGIVILIAGFGLAVNPLVVVTTAGLATGVAAGQSLHDVIAGLGRAYVDNRYLELIWLILPVIGMLERCGLRERAQDIVRGLNGIRTGRLLIVYLVLRQLTVALGLNALGGQPQMVRPLLAPMAEGASRNRFGKLPEAVMHRIRAHAAAADNVGLFFAEDIFIAVGSILLMKGFLQQNGVDVGTLDLAFWAVPTALCALLIHGTRLWLFDRWLERELGSGQASRRGRGA